MSSRSQSSPAPALLVLALTALAVALAWALDGAALGRTARLASSSHQAGIVSLAPAITETLFAIGAGTEVIAVSDYCDHPTDVRRLPRVGTGYTPDLERLARLGPALILTDGHQGARQAELQALAPARALDWLTLDDFVQSIRELGEVTGHQAAAHELANQLRVRLDVMPPRDAPRVLLVHGVPLEDSAEIWYIQPDCLHDSALRAAGGRNAAPPPLGRSPRMSVERLLEIDPDLIVILAGPGYESETAQQRLIAGFQRVRELGAARAGRIGVVQDPAVFATGPRIIELIERLQHAIERLRRPAA